MKTRKEELLEEICTVYTEIIYNNTFVELMCSSEEKVLWLIAKQGGTINPKQLSDIMDVTMPRITTLLNAMDAKGLITRSVATDDRRKVNVTITKKGRDLNRKLTKRSKDYMTEVIDELTEEESEAVLKYLKLRVERSKTKNAVD